MSASVQLRRAAVAGIATGLLALAAVRLAGHGSDAAWLEDALLLTAAALAVAGAVGARDRLWLLVAAGVVAFVIASLGGGWPRPSPADELLRTLLYAAVAVATLRVAAHAKRLRTMAADAAILLCAPLWLIYVDVLEPLLHRDGVAHAELSAVAVLADLTLLALLAALWLACGRSLPRTHVALAAGLAALCLHDVLAADALAGGGAPAGLAGLVGVSAALLLAAAPWVAGRPWAPLSPHHCGWQLVAITAAIVGVGDVIRDGDLAAVAVPATMFALMFRMRLDALETRRLMEREHERADREHRYRTIFQTIARGLVVTDLEGRITSPYPHMAALVGCPAEQLVGTSLLDWVSPADRETLAERLAGDRLTSERRELRLVRPDGVDVWVMVASAVLPDGDGRPVGHVWWLVDITAQKRADADLRRSERMLIAAERMAQTGSWTVPDPAAGEMVWSDGLYRIAGLPVGTRVTVESLLASIEAEDRGRVRAVLEQVLETGDSISTRYAALCGDGVRRVIHAFAERVDSGDGYGLMGVVRDVTESETAEEALRRSEQRYRHIVETGGEGVWMLDASGNTSFVNRRMAELLELSVDEILGRPLRDFLPSDQATLLELQLGSGVINQEVTLRRDGGEPMHAHVSATKVSEEGGGDGALIMVADMTHRIEAERRGEQLQEMLFQAQKLESIGQLAGGVAHDFNNVLAIIRNYADFAAQELHGHPAQADVLEVRKAAQRASGLTRQLLVFSRQESVRPEPLNLNFCVNETLAMLRRLVGANVQLELGLAEQLPAVLADSGQVEQILVNLAINARDAMPDGGRLGIATEVGPDTVRLIVSDNGTGMPSDVAARAFDPFFTTKPKGAGTGLGLATVYAIATRSGGTVTIDSEPGRGTALTIELPIVHEEVAKLVAHPRTEARRGGGETVLVVEDEPALREVSRRILVAHGYRVIEAPDGDIGLELLDELGDELDILITDVVLPGVSGPSLAAHAIERRPDLPVLFISGYTDRSDLPRDTARFLPKPYGPDELLERVDALLRGASRSPVAS